MEEFKVTQGSWLRGGGEIYIEEYQKNDSLQPSSGESKLKKNAMQMCANSAPNTWFIVTARSLVEWVLVLGENGPSSV